MTAHLRLEVDGHRVGDLVQDRGGALRLTVHDVPDAPRLSSAFTPSDRPVPLKAARAYLEGLLPGSEAVREASARRFGISPRNPFALLSAIGADCAGAVQVLDPDAAPVITTADDLRPVTDQEIAQRLRDLRTGTAPWVVDGEHWSLGGAQAKFALRREDSQWCEALGRAATSHIMKPGMTGFASQAIVEHVSLRALHHAGLSVARTEFRHVEDQPAIVIERYDRLRDARGTLRRIHQEDFCQATSTLPRDKYRVTAQQAATALRRGGAAEAEIYRFAQAVLANWVFAAPNAHAKNYSVFLGPERIEALAPLYDVATGLGHGDWSTVAMPIGGEKDIHRITGRHVAEFAKSLGISAEIALLMAAQLARVLPAAFALAAAETPVDGAEEDALEQITERLGQHCGHILTMLERLD